MPWRINQLCWTATCTHLIVVRWEKHAALKNNISVLVQPTYSSPKKLFLNMQLCAVLSVCPKIECNLDSCVRCLDSPESVGSLDKVQPFRNCHKLELTRDKQFNVFQTRVQLLVLSSGSCFWLKRKKIYLKSIHQADCWLSFSITTHLQMGSNFRWFAHISIGISCT